MNIKKSILIVNVFSILILTLVNCNEEQLTVEETTVLDVKEYKIDFNKSYIDLSNDERFQNLTQEQMLKILNHYSPGEVNTGKANCSNCVYHVRGFDSRLMPVDSGCNIHYKWTNTGCLGGKKKLINSCYPSVGSAVIMDTGIPEGHVAYVETVLYVHAYEWYIKINEGNRPSGTCRTIWLYHSDPLIEGYQNPNLGINCNNQPFSTCGAPYGGC
jgi:hypothetical protein